MIPTVPLQCPCSSAFTMGPDPGVFDEMRLGTGLHCHLNLYIMVRMLLVAFIVCCRLPSKPPKHSLNPSTAGELQVYHSTPFMSHQLYAIG